mgnify:CR=1
NPRCNLLKNAKITTVKEPEVGRGLANTEWIPCMLTVGPPLQT